METRGFSNQTDLAHTDLKPGDHLCWLYETEEEYRVSLGHFLREGIEQGQKVLGFVNNDMSNLFPDLVRRDGARVGRFIASGQLYLLPVENSYVRHRNFDPDATINLLRKEASRARDEGYSALRVIGDMNWVLQGMKGSERFVEYEYMLDAFLPGSNCLAICPYDQRRFGPMLLLYVMATHPKAVIGTEIYDNFYYMPPPDCLGNQGISAATLHHWLEDLTARKQANLLNYEGKELVQVS